MTPATMSRRLATCLRRCWNCGRAIGARDKLCAHCGARQRDPNRASTYQWVGR